MAKVVKFQGITKDILFKMIFSKPDVLQDFIDSYLEFVGEHEHSFIRKITPQYTMFPEKAGQKTFYGDIVAELDDGSFVGIEMCKTFNEDTLKKSASYMCSLYNGQFEEGREDYKSGKKVIVINLMEGNYKKVNNDIVNDYEFLNRKVMKKSILPFEFVLIRLDNYETIAYNENSKRFIDWIRFINAKTLEELREIGKENEIMGEAAKNLTKYYANRGKTWEEYLAEERKEGLTEGKLENQKEVAANMIKENLDDNLIKKITGLSINAIKKIKTTML